MANVDNSTGSDLIQAMRFQRDLYLFWRTVLELGGVALTSRGFINRPALRRLRARLGAADGRPSVDSDVPECDDLRLFFIRRLTQRLGLLTPSEARLVACEREKLQRFFDLPLAERLGVCLRVWVAGGWWPDSPDPSAGLPRLLLPAPPRLALIRRRLIDSLTAAPAGERRPIPLPVSTSLRSHPHRASASRQTPKSRPRELPPDTEANTVRAALCGPLAWMGIVDCEAPAEVIAAAPETCVVTSAAKALRREHETVDLPEIPGRVIVQSNFEVIAFPPLAAPVLLLLDTCAVEISLDQTARYRLARESFLLARQRGWTAQDIAARLEVLTSIPLPANVRVTLDDWERRGERLRVTEHATILEVHEPGVLDALLADRAAAGWVQRRLTSTLALLIPEHAGHVRTWLLRRGNLPSTAE